MVWAGGNRKKLKMMKCFRHEREPNSSSKLEDRRNVDRIYNSEYCTRACYTILIILGILLQRYFGARCRDFGDMPAGFLADCVTRISLGSLPG